MAGLVPAIHVDMSCEFWTWMPATRAGMTVVGIGCCDSCFVGVTIEWVSFNRCLFNLMLSLTKHGVVALVLRQAQDEGSDGMRRVSVIVEA